MNAPRPTDPTPARRRAPRLGRRPSTTAPAVLAVTGDDDRYRRSRDEAVRIAAGQGSRLILYDWDAATILGDPLPSIWSGEGTDEATPSELDEGALEAAGRAPLAQQVRDAQRAGVDATAWLPSKPGPDAMIEWARDHGATTIVVPEDLGEHGKLERLAAGHDPAETVEAQSPMWVVVVPKEETGR
jgi:hypothetical protein